MKYLKTYETHSIEDELNIINKILNRYYEKNEKGKDTGFSIRMNYNERQLLMKDGLIQVDTGDEGGGIIFQYYIRKKDRQTIIDKLELIRAVEKYNM